LTPTGWEVRVGKAGTQRFHEIDRGMARGLDEEFQETGPNNWGLANVWRPWGMRTIGS
jgi:hypothetical protein